MTDVILGGGVSGPLEVRQYSSGAYAVGIWDGDSGFHVVAIEIPTLELAMILAAAPDLLAGISGIRCHSCNRWLDEPWPRTVAPCPHCDEAHAARLKAIAVIAPPSIEEPSARPSLLEALEALVDDASLGADGYWRMGPYADEPGGRLANARAAIKQERGA